MSAPTEVSRRPNLQPLWTDYNMNTMPRIGLGATPSPAGLSPSPMSPRALPSPMYPRSYDGSMRTQERALVDSLNQRSRHPSLASPATLVPIDEQLPLAARFEKVTILPPIQWNHGLPSPTSPHLPSPKLEVPVPERYRPASVAAASRGPPPPRQLTRPGLAVDRRASAPAVPQLAARRGSAIESRERLRAWGHRVYGNAESAHAFVIARSLRRPRGATMEADGAVAGRQQQQPRLPSRQTVRAIIHPRAPERKPFLIQRNFDMDQLRATIPDHPSLLSSDPSRRRPSGVGQEARTWDRPGVPITSLNPEYPSPMPLRDAKAVPIRK